MQVLVFSGGFFYQKSTIGTTKATIEANNGKYCLRKRIEKFPLYTPCAAATVAAGYADLVSLIHEVKTRFSLYISTEKK